MAGETRGNLAAGGTGVAQQLTERDFEIASTVGKVLKQKGLFLVGLDVIGGRIVYGHTAGHYEEAPDLLIDTHGATVIDPVWDLLADAYRLFGNFPTLLERDTNIPPLLDLMPEVERIAMLQSSK